MKKTIIKRIIFGILIILNCLVIFRFSAQPANESSQTSGVIVNKIVDGISNINKNAERAKLEENTTFVVRKLAHLTIYTLLGIWLICFANTFSISDKNRVACSIIFGMAYASSDEFHQKFVEGRSPEIRDVCLDTCGIILGILIILIIRKIKNATKKS